MAVWPAGALSFLCPFNPPRTKEKGHKEDELEATRHWSEAPRQRFLLAARVAPPVGSRNSATIEQRPISCCLPTFCGNIYTKCLTRELMLARGSQHHSTFGFLPSGSSFKAEGGGRCGPNRELTMLACVSRTHWAVSGVLVAVNSSTLSALAGMSCPVNLQALPSGVFEAVFTPENARARWVDVSRARKQQQQQHLLWESRPRTGECVRDSGLLTLL